MGYSQRGWDTVSEGGIQSVRVGYSHYQIVTMQTKKDQLQIPANVLSSHKKMLSADPKMSSESDMLDDRADSGLGSLGPTSFEHSGDYHNSLKSTLEHPERHMSRVDNLAKLTESISLENKEDDLTGHIDSGLGSLGHISRNLSLQHSEILSEKTNEDSPLDCDYKSFSVIVPMEQRVKLFEGDRDGDNKLHLSILNGDFKLSILLIKLAPHFNWLNYCNHLWQTPLHLAVLTNQVHVVRRLLCAGADATCQDKDGNTPLHIACRGGYEDIVRCLLTPVQKEELSENTYDIPFQRLPQDFGIRNYEGETCLHIAVRNSHVKIVALLLKAGIDINLGDGKSGRTALHIASELNNVDMIKIILYRSDAKIDVRNYAGLTPVQLAYGRGHSDSVDEICRHGNYSRADISLCDSSDEDEDMVTDSD
ncbi:Nuclear factor NF-kappa-B p105 subunit [Bulinus truncatus]|nr:Nuclear factor NF-kappa-B p105 subunit [Bulinus truncatus]